MLELDSSAIVDIYSRELVWRSCSSKDNDSTRAGFDCPFIQRAMCISSAV